MGGLEPTTTTASRSTLVSGSWLLGAGLILGSGVLAALVLGSLMDGTEAEVPWLALAGALVVLMAGGCSAALAAGRDLSRSRVVAAVLMPVPTILLAFVLMVGLSQSEDDLPAVYSVTARLLAIWEVPLVLTLLVRAARQLRSTKLPPIPVSLPPLDRELAAATLGGRAVTVVRRYVGDEEGRARLMADTEALASHGYELVSVEERPGRRGITRALTLIKDLLLQLTLPGRSEELDDQIMATFRRGG